jgi:glycosyltransferase involved in cell wall biosynthesis
VSAAISRQVIHGARKIPAGTGTFVLRWAATTKQIIALMEHMGKKRRTRLSVYVICKDEADRIEDCLKSVVGWADEIVVLDSGSSDGTLEIARSYADCLVQTDWPGYGPQRNRALQQVSGDWVFSLDSDERLTPQLRDEIDEWLDRPGMDCTLLKMPWRTWFLGKPLRFGRYTAPQGKLFKREGAVYPDKQVHESLILPVLKVGVLNSHLEHFSWRSYAHAQEKHLKYASFVAREKYAEGRRGTLALATLRFFTDFFHQFLLRGGFIDGWRGFLMAVLLGQYAFHKYAALATLEYEDPQA